MEPRPAPNSQYLVNPRSAFAFCTNTPRRRRVTFTVDIIGQYYCSTIIRNKFHVVIEHLRRKLFM